MNPVRTAHTEIVYRGPSPDVGDLWCRRVERGVIQSIWEPDEEERRLLAEGGRVVLTLYTEPIPPISMQVASAKETEPVGEHSFRVIPELDDEERQ